MTPTEQEIGADAGPEAADDSAADDSAEPERSRSRRPREVRAKTLNLRRLPQYRLALDRALAPDEPIDRPRTRGECEGVYGRELPCPFVGCRHHLYLDVNKRTGNIKLNFPDLEPDELEETCSLDVADRGPRTLHGVGDVMNLTRERTRQIEAVAQSKVASRISPELRRELVGDDR